MHLGCELIDADTSSNSMGRREYIKISNRSTTIQKRDVTFSSIFGSKLFQMELCFIYDIDDQELLSFRYNDFYR